MNSSWPVVYAAIAAMLLFPPSPEVRSQEIAPRATASVGLAWETLRDGLTDNDAEHRKTAVAAVGTIGDEHQAVKLVEQALQDKDSQVRQTAAATLGQMSAREAIPNLKAALNDNPEVTFTAAKALWNLGDPTGREIFQEVLEGDRTNAPGKLHGAVKDGKKKLGPGQLTLMGAKETTGALFGPASLGITAVQEAIKTAKKDTGAGGRSIAAEVLGQDSDEYALILLEWALADDNWGVRVAVAKALGERGNSGTIAKLEPLLKDDHHAVRYMAAASMVKLGSKNQTSAAK